MHEVTVPEKRERGLTQGDRLNGRFADPDHVNAAGVSKRLNVEQDASCEALRVDGKRDLGMWNRR